MEPPGGLRRFGNRCACGTAHARYFLEFSDFLTLPRAGATYWGAPTDKEILLQLPGLATGLPGPSRTIPSGTPLQGRIRVAAEGHHHKEFAP